MNDDALKNTRKICEDDDNVAHGKVGEQEAPEGIPLHAAAAAAAVRSSI